MIHRSAERVVMDGAVLAAAVLACASLRAQDIVWRAVGPPASRFGTAAAVVDDLNGDGVRDVLVGAPWYPKVTLTAPGELVGLDGATGAQLFVVAGAPSQQIGYYVADLGSDVNGDGVGDFMASGNDTRSSHLYSGKDRSVLLTIAATGKLASIDDLDGDGLRDIVVGTLSAYQPDVTIWSSASGARLRRFPPVTTGYSQFGAAYDVVGDLDADGTPDLVIGDQYDRFYWGSIFVYSVKHSRLLKRMTGPSLSSDFGDGVTGLDDLDGDGVADFAASGRRRSLPLYGHSPGFINVYSGRTLVEIARFDGTTDSNDLRLGRAIGDLDGDGVGDFIQSEYSPRTVSVFSGRTLARLADVTREHNNPYYSPETLAFPAFDLDGDGFDEVLLAGEDELLLAHGSPRFLSTQPSVVQLPPPWPPAGDHGNLGSPSPPSSPGVGRGDSFDVAFTAAGFAPGTLLTIYLTSDDGVALFQPVLTGVTDAVGNYVADLPWVPSEPHLYTFQAWGLDSSGQLLRSPIEELEFR